MEQPTPKTIEEAMAYDHRAMLSSFGEGAAAPWHDPAKGWYNGFKIEEQQQETV